MGRTALALKLSTVLLVGALPLTVALAWDDRPPARIELAKPPVLTRDRLNVIYGGTVTEVTKDSITIEWPGESPARVGA